MGTAMLGAYAFQYRDLLATIPWMLSDLSAVFFGLSSAACWGVGDFSGGLASKRSDVYSVVAFSQMFGVTLLMALAILISEAMPSAGDMLLGAIAGIFGALGLVALYAGLAGGRMGVVAPVTAVVTAAGPVIFSIFLEGLPAGRQMAGFGLAFIAVWLLSYAGHGAVFQVKDLALPVASGLGFGVFLLLIGRGESICHPLAPGCRPAGLHQPDTRAGRPPAPSCLCQHRLNYPSLLWPVSSMLAATPSSPWRLGPGGWISPPFWPRSTQRSPFCWPG